MIADTTLIVAQIGPSLVGVAALVTAIRVKKDTKAINNAVNHREPGEMKLIDLAVDSNARVERVEKGLNKHLGWHSAKDFVSHEEVDDMIDEALGR